MNNLDTLTKNFTRQSQIILKDHLVGIYLHGSAAMGCFNPQRSDIDLLVVVNAEISGEIKRRYMDMVVQLNTCAPRKGIEVSIIREEVCRPFIYPTPFELHFSNTHLEWYKTDPSGYIEKMNGTDKDLAAHVTIIYHRGKCLYGKEIKDVFEKVEREFYFDSIWCDVKDAKEEITEAPTYVILNLCRVLAYKEDGLILSKKEGGEWGLNHVPEQYRSLILQALDEYLSNKPINPDHDRAHQYAEYMIKRIRTS